MGIFDFFRKNLQSSNPWDIMRAECVMLTEKFDMGNDTEQILKQIDQMVDHAKSTNEPIENHGKSISAMAYACVFNAASFILMSHKYNLSDSMLSLQGEFLMQRTKRIAQEIVEKGFAPKEDMDILVNNMVSTTFFK